MKPAGLRGIRIASYSYRTAPRVL